MISRSRTWAFPLGKSLTRKAANWQGSMNIIQVNPTRIQCKWQSSEMQNSLFLSPKNNGFKAHDRDTYTMEARWYLTVFPEELPFDTHLTSCLQIDTHTRSTIWESESSFIYDDEWMRCVSVSVNGWWWYLPIPLTYLQTYLYDSLTLNDRDNIEQDDDEKKRKRRDAWETEVEMMPFVWEAVPGLSSDGEAQGQTFLSQSKLTPTTLSSINMNFTGNTIVIARSPSHHHGFTMRLG